MQNTEFDWAFWKWRRELVAPLRGRILEIGCGTGPTFRHYHSSCEVWAVEQELERCLEAQKVSRASRARFHVQHGNVQSLPFPTGHFDAAVSCLVLCSVPDQQEALAEIGRVLRQDGVLRLMEHVIPLNRAGNWLANAIQPWWSAQLNGCQPNRDTAATILKSGWRTQEMQRKACVLRGTFTPPPQPYTKAPATLS